MRTRNLVAGVAVSCRSRGSHRDHHRPGQRTVGRYLEAQSREIDLQPRARAQELTVIV